METYSAEDKYNERSTFGKNTLIVIKMMVCKAQKLEARSLLESHCKI
jgi:hypothetical protein